MHESATNGTTEARASNHRLGGDHLASMGVSGEALKTILFSFSHPGAGCVTSRRQQLFVARMKNGVGINITSFH